MFRLRTAGLLLLMIFVFCSCENRDPADAVSAAWDELTWNDTNINWYYGVIHYPGNLLNLLITQDGLFIESRDASVVTISAELPRPVDSSIISQDNIKLIGKDYTDTDFFPPYTVSLGADLRTVRVVVQNMRDRSRYRIRLVDGHGQKVCERIFSKLTGDVNLDGTVDNIDRLEILGHLGEEVDASITDTVRCDLNFDGALSATDTGICNALSGNNLPLLPPVLP